MLNGWTQPRYVAAFNTAGAAGHSVPLGTAGRNGGDRDGVLEVRISRSGVYLAALVLVVAGSGCFTEQSFPLDSAKVVRMTSSAGLNPGAATPLSTRAWLTRCHGRLEGLLSRRGRHVLLTERMTDASGLPVDVYAALGKRRSDLGLILRNFNALVHSYQAAAPGYAIDNPAAPWPGFEDRWIPVTDGVRLCGRLGFAELNGQIRTADCIVLLPGIWGDNGVVRTRDLATGLRAYGFHVLALEIRGHGQTEARYPEVSYTFGVLETLDLLKVSEWLQDTYPQVRRTGLIGFCWGGNIALLAAWYEGCGGRHPSITDEMSRRLDPMAPRAHFKAGVITFSTVLDWERIVDEADRPHSKWLSLSMYAMQTVMADRMRMKEHPEVNGNLRRLIAYEYAESPLTSGMPIVDGHRFLRFVPHRDLPWDNKLSSIRVPTVIVHAINDPFTMAQSVADLMATTDNPNVAALILRGGGHIGFFPYNRDYAWSLILNFFDPETGVAVNPQGHAEVELLRTE